MDRKTIKELIHRRDLLQATLNDGDLGRFYTISAINKMKQELDELEAKIKSFDHQKAGDEA